MIPNCEEINAKHHYFTVLESQPAIQGELNGLFISVKDNICVKGMESTACSRILKGYKPLFDATCIARLREKGATIIGKTSQDAFGFGSFNINVGKDYPVPTNPFDETRVTGGSSGGAAGITQKADFNHVAIAESTGGSIETPASYCGVIGFCPTYGRISRYGLISYADSFDKIGIMAKKVANIAPVLSVMAGADHLDGTCMTEPTNLEGSNLKVAIIKESMDVTLHVKEAMLSTVEKLKQQGIQVDEVSMPLTFTYGVPAYYLISMSEASTNLARYSGLRYGQQNSTKKKGFTEYFTQIRTEHFNEESKRRIMLGTFARMAGYRDAYYLKALKVREQIREEYRKLFQQYTILISPTTPDIAPTFEEIKNLTPAQIYMGDSLTVGPNLAGVPHATIPIGFHQGMPLGLMATTAHGEEGTLLKFLKVIEDLA